MDNLTNEEKVIVEELRKRTINDMTSKLLEDASVFYRFAKARDFNIEESEAMLRKHIAWRKEMGIDNILTDYKPPEVLRKYVPLSFCCVDKTGCAVLIHDCGRADARGLLSAAQKSEIAKQMVYFTEQNRERLIKEIGKKRAELGKPIFYPIYDFDELTYAKAVHLKTIQLLLHCIKTFLDNYPEYLNTVTIINAPSFFAWVYALLKPILPSSVSQKVRIYGSDGWKEILLESIDADNLPMYLGGTRTDPDGNPLCETFILRGRTVPKSYYIKRRKKSLATEENVERLTVKPFSKQEITFNVKEMNSFLEWEFEIKNKDIDFSLLFRGGLEEEVIEIVPKQRIDTSFESEKGCFKCEKAGIYTILFDNSYSWIHSKEVYYRIGIKNSETNELLKPS